MDWLSALKDMMLSAEGLLLLAGSFGLWWLSGRIPNLFSDKEWSWKRGLQDLCKLLLAGIVSVGVTGLANIGSQFFAKVGWDITDAVSQATSYILLGAISGGFVFYTTKTIKNTIAFIGLKFSDKEGDKEQFEKGKEELTQPIIDGVCQFFTQLQADIDHRKEFEEVGGRGSYYNVPINSYDVFRSTVLGKGYDVDGAYGYQCWDGCALVWQQLGRNLITGNGCASGCWNLKRDVNAGNDFELIWKLSDVKKGDVMVFSAGTYGHIGFADENYNGSGVIRLLGQNQGGSPRGAAGGAGFNVINMNTASFLGAFRLKKWKNNDAAPAAPLKDLNVVAEEVRAGKWGNNPERANALRAAGYDADEVQSIVNALEKPKVTPAPAPKAVKIKEGDTVVPTKLIDYTGRPLRSYYATYNLKQLTGDRAVLYVGNTCWAALNVANIKKA